jgi:hypothetical protein
MSLITIYIPSVINMFQFIVVNKSKIYIDSDTPNDVAPVITKTNTLLHILLKIKPTLAKIRE